MNREEKFWNRMADGYSKSKISDEESYQKKLKISQSYFKPDMEVLEFGCGTGSTAGTGTGSSPCTRRREAETSQGRHRSSASASAVLSAT